MVRAVCSVHGIGTSPDGSCVLLNWQSTGLRNLRCGFESRNTLRGEQPPFNRSHGCRRESRNGGLWVNGQTRCGVAFPPPTAPCRGGEGRARGVESAAGTRIPTRLGAHGMNASGKGATRRRDAGPPGLRGESEAVPPEEARRNVRPAPWARIQECFSAAHRARIPRPVASEPRGAGKYRKEVQHVEGDGASVRAWFVLP